MLDIWKHDSYQHIFKKSIHKTTINNLKKIKNDRTSKVCCNLSIKSYSYRDLIFCYHYQKTKRASSTLKSIKKGLINPIAIKKRNWNRSSAPCRAFIFVFWSKTIDEPRVF